MRGSASMTRAFELSAVAPRRRRESTEPGRITYHEKSQLASKQEGTTVLLRRLHHNCRYCTG